MKFPLRLKPRQTWRNSLIVTTALTLLLSGAVHLWSAGWAEWAFVGIFASVWTLLSALWSNDDYIEKSNLMLADIVDHNFEVVHERLKQLEMELEKRDLRGSGH